MATDLYAMCPCGSGKKFKWCCEPLADLRDKAETQLANGQQEAALRTVDELVAKHSGNPQAWGTKAQFQLTVGNIEEAEAALDKAFEINPQYPFGNLLRATIREQEGEIIGALVLYRKASEQYSPEAKDILCDIFEAIGRIEFNLQRPIACRAALERALHLNPNNDELRERFRVLFGKPNRFPPAAARPYAFRGPDAVKDSARAAIWKKALPDLPIHARFGEAAALFEKLTADQPNDADAWFNLGLCRAWMGATNPALDALERSIELESDEGKFVEAVKLAEVLRFGRGAEERSDHTDFRFYFEIRDIASVNRWLQEKADNRKLAGVNQDPEQGTLSAMLVEDVPGLMVENPRKMVRAAAHLFIFGRTLRISHPKRESALKVIEEMKLSVGLALGPMNEEKSFLVFGDMMLEAMEFPSTPVATETEADALLHESLRKYFEEVWIHKPLKTLAGIPPIDAVQNADYRKRVIGLIAFYEESLNRMPGRTDEPNVMLYNFDLLRHKLGLATATPVAVTNADGSGPNFETMNAAELAGLNLADLTTVQLEEGFRAALRLDAQEIAGKFAAAVAARPVEGAADRWAIYQHLIEQARNAGDQARVGALLDEGRRIDAEANEGKRGNDYSLRIGQHHARQGEIERAVGVFEELLSKAPSDTKYYASAAESLLSRREGQHALRFAERGIAKARAQNNRDSEQHFLELIAAAKKQIG